MARGLSYAVAVDTGCYTSGQLSAVVLWEDKTSVIRVGGHTRPTRSLPATFDEEAADRSPFW